MKRHVQETGVRYWAGDDLIELQSEPLRVVEDFFSQFGNMIISGCEVNGDTLSKGLVALNGYDPNNNPVYKVAPVEATAGLTFPVYLSLKCEVIEREYGDGNMKPVKEVYTAELSTVMPGAGVSYLTIYENNSDNKRFADSIRPGSRKITLNNIQSNSDWIEKSDTPISAYDVRACVVDGFIFVLFQADEFWCYHPLTDNWKKKTSPSTPRRYATMSVVNDTIYLIGGFSNSTYFNTVECYDPNTDTWSTKSPMPTARAYAAAGVVGDQIYVIGGQVAAGVKNECYNTSTDSWSQRTDIAERWQSSTIAVVGNILFMIGGSVSGQYSNKTECYDPATDKWSSRADMPTARTYLTSVCVNGKIHVLGGQLLSNLSANINECYDPITNTWYPSINFQYAGHNTASVEVDGAIYVIGGQGRLQKNECYTPEIKKMKISGDSHMLFDKNVLWNNSLKPANIPFGTIGSGTLSLIENNVSGEINENLDITYNSL
jgi:N-acetylneuraminic acid mutarotase